MLPPEKYPITIRAFLSTNGERVWEKIIRKPEGLGSIYVPPLARRYGVPVNIEVIYGDGQREYVEA